MKVSAKIYDSLTLGGLIRELERCEHHAAFVGFDWGGLPRRHPAEDVTP